MKPNIDLAVDYIDMCIEWVRDIMEAHDNTLIGSEEFASIFDSKTNEIEDYLCQAEYELTKDKE